MQTELTNLLPPERVQSLQRDYLYRVGTLACVLLAGLLVAHGVMLVPAHAYMRDQQEAQEKRLAELSSQRASLGFEDVSARVNALSARASALASLGATPSASDTIRAVLGFPRPGISLLAFTFTPPSGDQKGSMTLRGTAKTRESLRAFDAALGKLPFVDSTDLPLSAYAKESDIPFSIMLTLSFTP